MNKHLEKLFKIANQLESSDPLLVYELEAHLRKLAITDPGRGVPFHQYIKETQQTLKDMKSGLNSMLEARKLVYGDDDGTPDKINLDEFVKGLGDDVKQLKSASVRVALFGDLFKGLKDKFTGKKKPVDNEEPVDSAKIEKETKYNRAYRELVDEITSTYDTIIKNPEKKYVDAFKKKLNQAISMGESILSGKYEEPSDKEPDEHNFLKEFGEPSKKKSPPVPSGLSKTEQKLKDIFKTDSSVKNSDKINDIINKLPKTKNDSASYKGLLAELFTTLKDTFEGETVDIDKIMARQSSMMQLSSFMKNNPNMRRDISRVIGTAIKY